MKLEEACVTRPKDPCRRVRFTENEAHQYGCYDKAQLGTSSEF